MVVCCDLDYVPRLPCRSCRHHLCTVKEAKYPRHLGDDIGYWNISHNNHGMMGYKTPNIDRVAREGIAFTDYYAQQSCTAGRAAFISGSAPVRSGMTKVGMPVPRKVGKSPM